VIAFGAPWALLALPLAGLPILLHLVQRREPPEVAFPAVRYLDDATRDHRRRIQLRHLLLLAIRTLLMLATILAAAGMRWTGAAFGGHAPSAMVLVVDNSASSGMVVDGEPLLDGLVRAANAVLDRATPADRLWLRTTDGPAIPGTAAQLRERLAAIRATGTRLDLGVAVTEGRALIASAERPGEVIVLTDLQSSAVTTATGDVPVLLLRPASAPPRNRQVAGFSAGVQPWGPEGGIITVSTTGTDTTPVPLALRVASRPARDLLLLPGIATAERVAALGSGWMTLTATLPPDEFRADDERTLSLRVAPPAVVRWDATDRFLDAALQVLVTDRRVMIGTGVQVGDLGPGPSVVLPPRDPALVAALNRRLAARGVAWRYGAQVVGEERSDSSVLLPTRDAVRKRVRLESAGGGGEVLASVSGEPWLVRSGDVLLVGSRFDPEWTALPLGTAFVPFLDALLSRAIRGEALVEGAVAGVPLVLPDRVGAVVRGGERSVVEGGAPWSPPAPGVYHMLAGEDTLGAVSVVLDPRESDLARADDATVRTLWGHTTVSALDEGPSRAFTVGGHGDLRGALLLLALLCVCAEVGLAHRTDQRN
jgi:hypothetical protein